MCPSGTAQRAVVEASLSTVLRPAFDVLDADRDGKISRDDLRTFYAEFTSGDADEEAIKSMISVADSNRDGFVEYNEFERVLGDRRGSSPAGRREGGVMEDVFRMMDKDGDGKLSHEDLKSYMQWAGFSASDADIKAMIALGGGGDEKDGVSYDGLLKILAIDFVG
ncbi:calcium-binding protein CP1-like [Juglans regia]|uniref:Calcium-binding protein CP1-like n=1 Tax=Juglans regia TaxID=51240 RepID=A0A2I4FXG4_JUGRE|nr:calcium-binding protein CP1-like [Juglans regia]